MTSPLERPPAAIARLVHLFHVRAVDAALHPFEIATDETVAVARQLAPETATEAVAWVLRRYAPGGDHRVPERAADLAGRLRLAAAAPALVDTLERLSAYDPVAHAVLRALEAVGAPAADPLLAAFGRCDAVGDRLHVAAALAQVPAGDARVGAALEGLLADAPGPGAALLAAHGDRAALAALGATLDRLELPPEGPGELMRLEEIVAVAHAIMALKGTLTAVQRDRFERAYARSDDLVAAGDPEEPVTFERRRLR